MKDKQNRKVRQAQMQSFAKKGLPLSQLAHYVKPIDLDQNLGLRKESDPIVIASFSVSLCVLRVLCVSVVSKS
jgi:hypothetical protein